MPDITPRESRLQNGASHAPYGYSFAH